MTRNVAYYHFLISPWSYLAIGRLNALVEYSDAIVDYLPIDVGRTFGEMGGTPPAKRHPARQRFRLEELARWSDHLGVPIVLQPTHFPADQTTAACMVHAVASGIVDGASGEVGHGAATEGAGAPEEGAPERPDDGARRRAARLSDAVLGAVWRDERDIADPATLVSLAGDCGLDGQAVLEAARDERVRARYDEATRTAHERGVFGSPTWVVGEELFWGQDRLDFLARALGVVNADG